MKIEERVVHAFQNLFGGKPALLVRAPGRVNLIGEHTDYNDGFVLPMAIDQAVWIALRPISGKRVKVTALDLDATTEFDLQNLKKAEGWGEYLKGVAWAMGKKGLSLKGWEGVLSGDIPRGAGLSSSAAMELAAARSFSIVSDLKWDPVEMAKICQDAEVQWVGVKSGIMDQMISSVGKKGHALFLDCRSLEFDQIPVPDNVTMVVMDTSTRRGLVDSAYNERFEQCQAAARHFEVSALRDIGLARFNMNIGKLDDTIMRRARHVITENQRVLDAIATMREGDVHLLGKLFNDSHASLRDDFEVTNTALNQIVEIAQAHSACYGARMTGAGFGGCAVALVRREQVGAFVEATENAYQAASGLDPAIYVCQPCDGVSAKEL